MKKIHFQTLLIFLGILVFGCQCDDDLPEFEFRNEIEFELPFKVFPTQEEYSVGDTIVLSVLIQNGILKDQLSQELVNIKCQELPVFVNIADRLRSTALSRTNPGIFELGLSLENNPEMVVLHGERNSSVLIPFGSNNFDGDIVELLTIIPKEAGIFGISLGFDSELFINRTEDCNFVNPIFDKASTTGIFDLDNVNASLLNEVQLPVGTLPDNFETLTAEKRMFWFKVE